MILNEYDLRKIFKFVEEKILNKSFHIKYMIFPYLKNIEKVRNFIS